MKLILVFSLFLSQVTFAVQTCEDYITDEWPDSRYSIEIISEDNVVIDKKTGLMWKQCTEGHSGNNCTIGPEFPTYNWREALIAASSSNFAEYSNWRVPNIKELQTIVARNCSSPSINKTIFIDTQNLTYWTSTPFFNSTFYSIAIWFLEGEEEIVDRDVGGFGGKSVRLVRNME